MKTHEFLALIRQNPNKELLFRYAPEKTVGANYHITEVKNVTIDTVDCGGGTNFWKETIVQLWESPKEIGKQDFLTTDKALEILNRVDSIKPLEKEVEVKFEYGNAQFHTAQLFVHNHHVAGGQLIVALGINATNCKANGTFVNLVQLESVSDNGCTAVSVCC
ncbi:DUF6428 family protein [Maribacter chungangensis]|uniref:DUF6428 family protein n=1 Tax=Maribacter chungangensis TaxID=1069117 RepID=A0ABW3AZI2_9FLAO